MEIWLTFVYLPYLTYLYLAVYDTANIVCACVQKKSLWFANKCVQFSTQSKCSFITELQSFADLFKSMILWIVKYQSKYSISMQTCWWIGRIQNILESKQNSEEWPAGIIFVQHKWHWIIKQASCSAITALCSDLFQMDSGVKGNKAFSVQLKNARY